MFQESRKAFDGINREYRRGLAEVKAKYAKFDGEPDHETQPK